MEVSGEEDELVQLLKGNCFTNGKEKCPTESVEIFHGLGKIYRQKSPDKISLIQSAALFNAAIVRKPAAEHVKESLEELCSHTLVLSNAVNQSNLLNLASDFKKEFDLLRMQVNDDLNSLKNMQEGLTAGERHKFESQRINDIQVIQENISVTFGDIMKRIAERCVVGLGKPPCQYALVGMGSLAKREVTPYSDFECIIILEDQPETNMATNVEYFRWFAVVFQMILINFGETLVPCVAVPTLNNAYNNDPAVKKKYRWFYDAYTPSGISFDGMVPFACKSPLGRQHPTDAKPWKTELIRTVSDMLEYLSRDEDLKNGYHIADMLTKTCFVQGDETVYDKFYNGVCLELETYLKSDGPLRDVYMSKILSEFREDYDKFNFLLNAMKIQLATQVDVKKFVFRTPTLAVASLGRYHGIHDFSCNEIVSLLAEKQILTTSDAHKIKYTLAVSCELRQKVYCERSAQNDNYGRNGRSFLFANDSKATTQHLEILVGKQALRNCLETGLILQELTYGHFYLNWSLDFQSNVLLFPYDLCVLDMLGVSTSEVKTLVETKYIDNNELRFIGEVNTDVWLVGHVNEIFPEKAMQLASKILNQYESNEDAQTDFSLQCRVYLSVATSYFTMKHFEKCHKSLEKALHAIELDENSSENHGNLYLLMTLSVMHICYKETGKPLEALEATERILRLTKLFKCDLIPEQLHYNTLEAKAKLLEDLKLTEEAVACLNQCVEWRRRVAADPGHDNFWCQYQLGLYCCFVDMKRPDYWLKVALQLVTGNPSDRFEGGDLLLYVCATAFLLQTPQQGVDFCRNFKPQLHACFANGEVPVHSPRITENLGKVTDPGTDFVGYTFGSFLSLYGECLYKQQKYEEGLAILQEAKEQFQKEPFANPEHVEFNEMLFSGCQAKISAKARYKSCTSLEWKWIKVLVGSISNYDRIKSLTIVEDLVQDKSFTVAYLKIMETRAMSCTSFDDIDTQFLLNLARCYHEFGRQNEAISVCECAIDIRRQIAQNPCDDKTLCALTILLNDSHRQLGCSPVKTHNLTPLVSVHAFNLMVKDTVKSNIVLTQHNRTVNFFDTLVIKFENLFQLIVDTQSHQDTMSLTRVYATFYSIKNALKLMDYNNARLKAVEMQKDILSGNTQFATQLSMISFALQLIVDKLAVVKGTRIDNKEFNCELIVNEKLVETWGVYMKKFE